MNTDFFKEKNLLSQLGTEIALIILYDLRKLFGLAFMAGL